MREREGGWIEMASMPSLIMSLEEQEEAKEMSSDIDDGLEPSLL